MSAVLIVSLGLNVTLFVSVVYLARRLGGVVDCAKCPYVTRATAAPSAAPPRVVLLVVEDAP